MHAFLLVGKGPKIESEIVEISNDKKSKVVNFELKKIEDVRNLTEQTRLKLTENVSYTIRNIEDASEEALNAFLKNLEEPQEGLTYILTTENASSVLPTIVSRCKVIRIANESQNDYSKIEEFKKLSEGKRFAFIDQIKERDAAIKFIEDYIGFEHKNLVKGSGEKVAANLTTALKTLKRIKANGNVTLQLANFVTSLV